jgi:hypothetical protein
MMSEQNKMPRIDFSMGELKAIVDILNADKQHSLQLIGTLSGKKRIAEKKRLQRIETIKRNVTNQILINHIGLVLTREDVQDILHAINVSSTYFRRHPSKGIHGGMNDRKRKQKSFFCVSMGAGLTYRMDMSCQGRSVACLDRTCPCGTLVAAIAASETAATRLGAVIKRIGSATGSPFN